MPNLFRFDKEAKRRQVKGETKKEFDTTGLVEKLVKLSEASDDPMVYPVKHHVRYELAVHKDNPLVKAGGESAGLVAVSARVSTATARREADQERSRGCEDCLGIGAAADRIFRADYFKRQRAAEVSNRVRVYDVAPIAPSSTRPRCKPYDEKGQVYREFTAERPPHIVFTPEVKRLAKEIVGDETNPLEKARKIFRWMSKNVPWCAEVEYSIIPSLSVKGLTARQGDCGVQGTSFITLCRAAGVPARWQSGWQTKPGDVNMHDWSEIYIEPWGWLPADASYGVCPKTDPRVHDFYCGHLDPYRMIVNLDYGRELEPPKTSFRSEPTDFQRGEIEIDGHNLYFDQWEWKMQCDATPLADAAK